MADVADGRDRPHARPGPSLRQIQQGKGAVRRGALSQGSAPALRSAGPPPCGPRVRGGGIFDRRYRDLAVDLALRMADHRARPISQREALVRRDRAQARGRARLSRAQEGERNPDAMRPRRQPAKARIDHEWMAVTAWFI